VTSAPFTVESTGLRKRNSAKAIIFENDKVLLTRNEDPEGTFYLLPGGGQNFGETLTQALVREVMEETGYIVEPGKLLLVRDYVGANHEFAGNDGDAHQTEHMFRAFCRKHDSGGKLNPDAWQTGMDWIPLSEIGAVRIYPSVLAGILPQLFMGKYEGPVYLGDVN
jgi:ADP-ribose pyrophosphatase YjhB (NUDIX family)